MCIEEEEDMEMDYKPEDEINTAETRDEEPNGLVGIQNEKMTDQSVSKGVYRWTRGQCPP